MLQRQNQIVPFPVGKLITIFMSAVATIILHRQNEKKNPHKLIVCSFCSGLFAFFFTEFNKSKTLSKPVFRNTKNG